LAPQPSLGLGLLLKIRLNFLEASQQFFYMVRLLAPRPTPITEDQASVFISPRGRSGSKMKDEISESYSMHERDDKSIKMLVGKDMRRKT
jgi:hypothetical protein